MLQTAVILVEWIELLTLNIAGGRIVVAIGLDLFPLSHTDQ